jgi:hypothetical protein
MCISRNYEVKEHINHLWQVINRSDTALVCLRYYIVRRRNRQYILSRARVTLRLAIYRQSVHLGDKPLKDSLQAFFQANSCFHSPYVTLSLPRGWVSFTIAAGPRPRSHSQVRVSWDSWPYFTVSDSRLLQTGGPVFISLRNRVAQLYPQALGSLLVASYDSQGCGGDTGLCFVCVFVYIYI